jgi:hypothetical protein
MFKIVCADLSVLDKDYDEVEFGKHVVFSSEKKDLVFRQFLSLHNQHAAVTVPLFNVKLNQMGSISVFVDPTGTAKFMIIIEITKDEEEDV